MTNEIAASSRSAVGEEARQGGWWTYIPEVGCLCFSSWLALQVTLGMRIGCLGAGDPLNYLPVFVEDGIFPLSFPFAFLMLVANVALIPVLLFSTYFSRRGCRLLVCLASILCLLVVPPGIEDLLALTGGRCEERGMRAVAEWANPIVTSLPAQGGSPADAQRLEGLLRSLGTFDLRGQRGLSLHLIGLQDNKPCVHLDSRDESGKTFESLVERRVQLLGNRQVNYAVGVVLRRGWDDVAWMWTDASPNSSGVYVSNFLGAVFPKYPDGWGPVDNGD